MAMLKLKLAVTFSTLTGMLLQEVDLLEKDIMHMQI